LDDDVKGCAVTIGPILAETGYAAVYQARIYRLEDIISQSKAAHCTWREVLRDYISFLDQLFEDALALFCLQVQGYTSLVAITFQYGEGQAFRLRRFEVEPSRIKIGGIKPGSVSASGTLDLDDVSPQSGQKLSAKWARQKDRQVYYFQPFQWSVHFDVTSLLDFADS
jgi:hypothetical protein